MTRSVLVPLDASPLAEQALPLAAEIARATRARLRLVLVHLRPSPPTDQLTARLATSIDLATRKAERSYLRRTAAGLRGKLGRRVTGVTLAGPVAPTLIKYIGEIGADLVVMSTHGRGGVRRAWLGSVADQLVRSLEIPLVLIPADGTSASGASPVEILVALDGSPLAEGVLEPATALARAFGARLGLLQVVPPVLLADPPRPPSLKFREDLTSMRRQQAQDYLDDLAERMRAEGLRAGSSAVVGAPVAQTILDVARGEAVGMLAVATHGRGGLRRMMLGSVADKLVRGANKPVLVVRPRPAPRGRRRRG
ncbi:MAG: universal stress protein [Gemmatimonadales bacterium]